ncbi:response regulator [Paenibacillus frigoriresistens]|uniref:response regulator n=1 Tax=Paenibacillus alginolyticus TaxID=59839 RepID=UPI0015674AB2|nr:response regulator [Paenibacillus frigoriresistens]NRF91049.1 response regulator [Paenibacillus frigoriresistens]
MFRVVIVDDEPLVRIALRELIAWNEHNCEIIAEAADGNEALRLIEQDKEIDLIVMDIQMPTMDGIACLEKLQEMELRTKPLVVVLSAYSEYEYVRRAFLLGAVDYIVKTQMDPVPMNAVIRKAADQLQERLQQAELDQRQQEAERLKLRETGLFALLKENDSTVFMQLMQHEDNDRDWLDSSSTEGQVVVCILTDGSKKNGSSDLPDEQTPRYTLHLIRQALEGSSAEVAVLSMGEREYALVLHFHRLASQGQLNLRSRISEGMDRIVSHMKQYVNHSVSIGVSDLTRNWRQWHDAYRKARQLANLRFFEKEGRVFYPEHAAVANDLHPSQTEPWDRKELLRRLESGEPWQEEFDKALRYWNSLKNRPVMEIRNMYQAFLWEMGGLLHAKNLDWQDVRGQVGPPYEQLLGMTRMADVHEWLQDLITGLARQLDPRRLAVHSSPRLVDKAKAYIEAHYHEAISLTGVSAWVGVSESHLSKQFAKETGENFIAYVTHVRIQKAIHLMWGGMKLFEIAEKVGYPNQGHFSRMFKKVAGRTPQQYREDCRL